MTIFVGPSIWRSMDVRTATALWASMASNPTQERIIWAPLWNDALIGRSRSMMCTEFLKTDADVMIIIDDDIVWEAPDFWKIVDGCRETRGVYGGAYVTRDINPHISSRAYPNVPLDFRATPQRRPVEFQYLATGFMAIHRDVFASILGTVFEDAYGTHLIEECTQGADRPFYPFFSPYVCREDDGQLHYLSEDWAFSRRAREAGHPVHVDQSIMLMHMGWYPFTVADLNNPKPGFPSTGIDVVEVAGAPMVFGDPLLDNLVADIAEFAGDEPGTITRMLEAAPYKLNELWDAKGEQTEEEWYQREDVGLWYILDLARWHRAGGGLPVEYAAHLSGKTVLDFGSGNGTFSLAAARAGAEVTAIETNPELRRFTQFRSSRLKFAPFVLVDDLVEAYPLRLFDVIVAWHVFEHLADPEAILDELLSRLAPGGTLYTQSGFVDHTTHCHHTRDDWDQVLASRGLRPVADFVDEDGDPFAFTLEAASIRAGEAVAAGC